MCISEEWARVNENVKQNIMFDQVTEFGNSLLNVIPSSITDPAGFANMSSASFV